MNYVRMYADEDGETHFDDIEVELTPTNVAPPAPAINLSPSFPATQFIYYSFPVGYRGDWHPVPQKQIFFILSGEIAGEVSDGEVRIFKTGDSILGEDVKGKGHRTWVTSDIDVLMAVVQLR
jgi:quercetin dioxygenase-like cupin family protein